MAVVENRELRLDGHTMRDVRTGTDVYAVYNMATETKWPFRRPEQPCSFYCGRDDNRTPPVCLVTHDSNTEEQGISRNSFEAFPICWSPAEICYRSGNTLLTGDEVGETHIPSA